jgi:putative redox protein
VAAESVAGAATDSGAGAADAATAGVVGEDVAVGGVGSSAAGTLAGRPLAPGEVEVSDLAAAEVGLPAEWEALAAGGGHALRQEVRLGRHRLTIDEPVAQGGADAGPTPYGLLLAALGGCTAITMRLYAERKKLPLTGARVVLRSSKIHAADCRSCAEGTGEPKLDRIDIEIELQGELDEAQRARLLTIAGHCPVHRTLESKIDIVTRLV